MKKINLFIILCIYSISVCHAQEYSQYNWYFGNSDLSIWFDKINQEPEVIAAQSPPYGIKQSAIVTDARTGSPLFYSDGSNIYDASNKVMVNGAIDGNSSLNQGIQFIPMPGNADQYYAVYSNGTDLKYSIIDMSLVGNGALGGVQPMGEVVTASKDTNFTGITSPGEVLKVIIDGNQTWLLAQESGSTDIKSFQVEAGGMFTEVGTFEVEFVGSHISYSQAVGKIAISPSSTREEVKILDFDSQSGLFSNLVEVPNSGTDNQAPDYGVFATAWSPNGNRLYISVYGNLDNPKTGNLLQYSLDVNQTNDVIPSTLYRSYGLKLGPDNKIYHLYQENMAGVIQLAVISNPDDAFNAANYYTKILDEPEFLGEQFASTVPSPQTVVPSSIDFTFSSTCQNSKGVFSPTYESTVEPLGYKWSFGDNNGTTSTSQSPAHTYTTAGTFSVSLNLEFGNVVRSVTKTIVIEPSDVMLSLPAQRTLCPGETFELDAGDKGPYIWSTGETTQKITVDKAGTYSVLAGPQPCPAFGSTDITIYGEDPPSVPSVWYFGNKAGYNFGNQGGSLDDGAQNAPEGVAAYTDAEGKILFYTDGSTVYDSDHQVMANGNDIGGDPGSTQSALILPFAGDKTQYYIFTTKESANGSSFQMGYAIVDLKINYPKGDVKVKNKQLFAKSTEKLTTNSLNVPAWIVGHEYGNNTFRSYFVSDNGVGSPIITSIGRPHLFQSTRSGQGAMILNDSLLAITVPNEQTNVVEVFDFDNDSGVMSNPRTLDLGSASPSETPYGISFSPSSRRLYVSILTSSGSSIQEWKIDPNGQFSKLGGDLYAGPIKFGGMSYDPSRRLLVAADGASSLGMITPPQDEESMTPSTFDEASLMLASGTTSGLGLPNFANGGALNDTEPAIGVRNGCTGEELSFTSNGKTPDRETYFWEFGDGATSSNQNPRHTYSTANIYDLRLTITNSCDPTNPTIFNQKITIADPPVLTDETVKLCGSSVTLFATTGNETGWTYEWVAPNGVITNMPTLTVTDPGIYELSIRTPLGCEATATKTVRSSNPFVNLGANRTACQNEVFTLNAANPAIGTTYRWEQDGVVLPTTSNFLTVDTSTPGSFNIKATVTAADGCVGSGDINITVSALPDASNPTTVNTSGCPSSNTVPADGSITFDFTPDAGSSYTYSVTQGNSTIRSNVPALGPQVSITNLRAGSYTIQVRDEFSGCITTLPNNKIDDGGLPYTISAIDVPYNLTTCGGTTLQKIPFRIIETATGNQPSTTASIYINLNVEVYDINGNNVGPFTIEPDLALGDSKVFISPAATSVGGPGIILPGDYLVEFRNSVVGGNLTSAACVQTVPLTVSSSFDQIYTKIVEIDPTNLGDYANPQNKDENIFGCESISLMVVETDMAGNIIGDFNDIENYIFKWENTEPNSLPSTSDSRIIGIPYRQELVNGEGPKGALNYKVTVTQKDGQRCPGTDEINVTINDPIILPKPIIVGNTCMSNTAQLKVVIPNRLPGEVFNFTWADVTPTGDPRMAPFISKGIEGEIIEFKLDDPSFTQREKRRFTVNVNSNLRDTSDGSKCKPTETSETITLAPFLRVSIDDVIACDNGLPFTLKASVEGRSNTEHLFFKWRLNGEIFPQTTQVISTLVDGVYEVTITEDETEGKKFDAVNDNDKCSATDSRIVKKQAIDQLNIDETNIVICPLSLEQEKREISFDITGNFNEYRWTRDGEDFSVLPVVTITQGGEYSIVAKNNLGCETSKIFTVIEECKPVVNAPTAFSPNKNGMNDSFRVFTEFVTKFSITIYNRWGEPVYFSEDKNFRWDGTVKGKLAPLGSYSYVIKFESQISDNNEKKVQNGAVFLLK